MGCLTSVDAHTSGDLTADNMYLTFDSDSWTIFSMKFSSTGYYAFCGMTWMNFTTT